MAALDKRPVVLKDRSVVPFEHLQNLPRPVITSIDLGITLKDVTSATRTIEPSITDVRRVGYFSSDQTTQTDNSDILELKYVTGTIGSIIEDITKLRDDLSYTKHVMRGDYENLIDQKAAELYSHANEKVKELETIHTDKIETIRKSYRTQLSNAISKIAGEYKVYYDEILQGKTGHQDSRIRELKQKVEILEHYLAESEAEIKSLKGTLDFHEKKTDEASPVPPMVVSEFDSEKEHELKNSISLLETELGHAQNELATKEDESSKFKKMSDSLGRQLEEEKEKVTKLREDMDAIKKKNVEEKQRSERIAQGQRDALERDMKEKMENSEHEAQKQAAEVAEMQKMKNMARFQQEIDKRKSLEDDLRTKASEVVPSVAPDSELSRELDALRRLSAKHSQEVVRLTKELERCNRINEIKLAVMQRNFHALKDESYLRHTFERQAAVLHYATVGYAPSNPSGSPPKQPMKTPHGRNLRGGRFRSSAATPEGPPVPTPTPIHNYTRCSEDEELPPTGHFLGESNTRIPTQA